ncbi:septum formation initiator family protein [Dethiobacter alkaliphilus]|uniref:septum formation initiator family protein n=1 Tax=Dethiobacter alkaliphilus TaxID=427926 RepID=UPI00058B4329|nr:cell division protein FtsL [Dethiobacter alkaliphilus]
MLLVAKKRVPQQSFYDQQRARQKVANKKMTNRRLAARKLTLMGAVLLCAMTAIVLVAHFAYVVDVNHQISARKQELAALQDENKHLQLEIASLRSPQRLEQAALEIGLQYPGEDQFVYLTAGASGN